jgi:hypothetical protein
VAPHLLHYSDVENAYDHPERVGRLAGLVDERRHDRTLVFGTGDDTSPGVLPLVTSGSRPRSTSTWCWAATPTANSSSGSTARS